MAKAAASEDSFFSCANRKIFLRTDNSITPIYLYGKHNKTHEIVLMANLTSISIKRIRNKTLLVVCLYY